MSAHATSGPACVKKSNIRATDGTLCSGWRRTIHTCTVFHTTATQLSRNRWENRCRRIYCFTTTTGPQLLYVGGAGSRPSGSAPARVAPLLLHRSQRVRPRPELELGRQRTWTCAGTQMMSCCSSGETRRLQDTTMTRSRRKIRSVWSSGEQVFPIFNFNHVSFDDVLCWLFAAVVRSMRDIGEDPTVYHTL